MTPVCTLSLPLPPPDEKEIRRYARCPEGADEEILQCMTELQSLRGRVCWCECAVREAGGILDLEFAKTSSSDLRKTIHGCGRVLVFAATVGLLPDRLLAAYGRLSPLKAYLIQAAGTERIEAACDLFCDKMEAEYQSRGQALRPRFSPGYGDLPLTLQKELFAVLDCPGKIGLTLSEHSLMMPSKSVTAIVGIQQNKQENAL